MRIAVAQIEPIKGDIEENLKNHLKWVEEAVRNKADLIFFPELSLTGYEPTLAAELATTQDDARLNVLQNLSDENNLTIGVGLPTKEGDDLFVSMIIFRPHKARTTYSKQYLFPPEKSVFTAGRNSLVLPFETEVVSPAICYEVTNSAHYELAKRNKATVYIASVLCSVNGLDEELKTLAQIAKNMQLITFMANYVGTSGGWQCAGRSSVWNAQGELIGQLGEKEEGVLLFDTQTKEVLTVYA